MATIASLVVSIGADTAELRKGAEETARTLGRIEDTAAKMSSSLKDNWVNFAAAAGTAMVALKGAASQMQGWVTAANEQEDATARLTTALQAQGTFAPQVVAQYEALATTFQRTTRYSDELITEMQGLLTQVGGVMPEQMGAALKASTDLASGLRIDLRTATMMVGKAFEGQTGALTRAGVVIDETKLKAGDITTVLEGINEKFGNQAVDQAQTYAGQMARLGNQYDELKEKAGELLIRVLVPMLDWFTSLPESVQTVIGVVALLAGVIGPLGIGFAGLAGAVSALMPLLAGLPALLAPLSLLLGPAGLIALGVVALVAAWYKWDEIVAIAKRVVEGIKRWMVDMFQSLVVEPIKAKIDAVTGFFKGMYDAVVGRSYVPDMVDGIEENFRRMYDVMVTPSEDASAAVKQAFSELQTWINSTAVAYQRMLSETRNAQGMHDLNRLAADQALLLQELDAALAIAGVTLNEFDMTTVKGTQSILAYKNAQAEANEQLYALGMIAPTVTDNMASLSVESERSIDIYDRLRGTVSELARSFEQLANIAGGSFGGVAQAVGVLVGALDLAAKGTDSLQVGLGQISDGKIAAGLANVASGIMGIAGAFMQATAGGNTFSKALNGAMLGAQVGAQFAGPFGAAIGAAIGGVAGLLRGIFGGPDAQELAGREAAARFRAGLEAGLNEGQRAEAMATGNFAWAASVIAIRDAYIAAGHTEAEALAIADALWRAEKEGAGAVAEIIRQIQPILDEGNKKLAEQARLAQESADASAGSLSRLTDEWTILDEKLSNLSSIENMKEAFENFRKTGSLDLRTVLRELDRLHDSLGDNAAVLELMDAIRMAVETGVVDFARLGAAWGDIEAMLRAGVTIPIDWQMRSSGGGGGSDSSGSGDSQGYLTPEEAREAGVPWRPKSDFDWSDSAYRDHRDEDARERARQAGDEGTNQYHRGGIVDFAKFARAHRGMLAYDEVPIVAQRGEGIISRDGMQAFDDWNRGRYPGAGNGDPQLRAELAAIRRELARFPQTIGVAVRDGLVLTGVRR